MFTSFYCKDVNALSALSADCPGLETLGFYNCIFRELVEADLENYVDRAR